MGESIFYIYVHFHNNRQKRNVKGTKVKIDREISNKETCYKIGKAIFQ